MRFLVMFTLGFAAACGFAAYGIAGDFWWAGAFLLFLIFLLLPGFRRMSLVLLGCLAAFLWYPLYSDLFLADAIGLDGIIGDVSIRATDYSYETDYGMALDGILCLSGRDYRVRAYVEAGEEILPGECLSGSFRFRVTVPGGREESTHHPGKGIFLLAYQEGPLYRTSGESSLRDVPAKLRRNIRETLDACFPSDAAPFAKALLIGDTTDLSYQVDTDLKISGIRHVAAVSGLHVSILFALVSMISMGKRFWMLLLGLPALLLFAAVSGFTPSVCRACVMSALMLLGLLLDREYDGPTALAFASLVMLLCNPLVITNAGFQLSVSSVAGIYLFSTRIRNWLLSCFEQDEGKSRWISLLTSSVSTSLSALIFTAPLCAWYFGTVSLVSVLTNLLTLWLISIVFYGIMAVCLVNLVTASGAAALAQFLAFPIRFLLGAAHVCARLPLAAVYTSSIYVVLWLIFVYLLLGFFLLRKARCFGLLIGCCVLTLCLSVLAGWTESLNSSVQFTVLDVGQGQCLLFQSDGRNILVDCGGDRNTDAADCAAETLLAQGVSRLDGVIVTHMDDDHAGGVANLLSRISTQLLILPPVPTELSQPSSAQVVYAAEDLELTFGENRIRIFTSEFRENDNENSLCILFDTKKCDILVTGDRSDFGERSLIRRNLLTDVDVLIAGHHGARDAVCQELLQAVRPEIVCISVGRDNRFGHPSQETLKRLEDFGCAVYRTDVQGSITIRR